MVVLGAGFAGSLMALICRRLGYDVLLIDHGRHPRFAIGESSTPIGNSILQSLARRYDLPQLLPLAKFGSWCNELPELMCGLKRGFSYFAHHEQQPFGILARWGRYPYMEPQRGIEEQGLPTLR